MFRRNLPANPAFSQLATGSNSERQNYWVSVPVSPALVRTGSNVVAVELHRLDPAGPNLSFDLQLSEGAVDLPAHFTGLPHSTNGVWRIGIAGPAGSLVRVEACGDLNQWTEAGQVILTGGVGTFQEAASGAEPRFYRLKY